MPENAKTTQSSKNKNRSRQKYRKAIPFVVWVISLSVSVVSVGFLSWIAHYHVAEHSYRIKFFAESSLNLFILFAIAVQAYIYIRQWDAMERSLERTNQIVEKMESQLIAMNETMVAARRSAQAAEDSVEVAKGNAIYAQRAYVSVTAGDVMGNAFKLRVENCGRTPANDVAVCAIVKMGYTPPDVPKPKEGRITWVGILAPNKTYDAAAKLETEPTDKEKLMIGDPENGFRLWCVGVIRYDDIFETDPVLAGGRKTTFCFYQRHGSTQLQAWATGNEAT